MFKMVGVIQEIPEGGKSFLLRYCGFFGGRRERATWNPQAAVPRSRPDSWAKQPGTLGPETAPWPVAVAGTTGCPGWARGSECLVGRACRSSGVWGVCLWATEFST